VESFFPQQVIGVVLDVPQLTTSTVLAASARARSQTAACRWDKSNFDGNDSLSWLTSTAAILEELRTDLLAFGIQVQLWLSFNLLRAWEF
jgi:alpha-beta hydrolase superfamily lysophospholipase